VVLAGVTAKIMTLGLVMYSRIILRSRCSISLGWYLTGIYLVYEMLDAV
jgi:hypothetical protein